jgi:hypothetical protein
MVLNLAMQQIGPQISYLSAHLWIESGPQLGQGCRIHYIPPVAAEF